MSLRLGAMTGGEEGGGEPAGWDGEGARAALPSPSRIPTPSDGSLFPSWREISRLTY